MIVNLMTDNNIMLYIIDYNIYMYRLITNDECIVFTTVVIVCLVNSLFFNVMYMCNVSIQSNIVFVFYTSIVQW